ncbi:MULTISPECIES: ion transporter [Pseudoalteromonas]|uniref:Potassium channel protein n=2 Tax=Pseudoalteromonas TaxID=53246 RepID=Q3IFD0_PSET1|nr:MULTISPECIES: ion transporter [Pseudoalteromonas]MBB1369392.1 ion transporter [Pseudoalteromonas sp. SR45-4]MBB1405659.1 ion transporter [Pseudoalteromonas sp. SG44-5]MBE0419862.1 ion transporter [Pseudoalteromonas nigrifaciens]MBH0070608.1 ion transporter [Pseudoalteromonas sp. NZS127]MBH0091807.1 ion transporter [Pseudoalteromonas sp. SCQQ13]|tara:strand:+ start:6218 stop:7171 length:954 start_codon:yes stop_codon:yes gene_type:complete
MNYIRKLRQKIAHTFEASGEYQRAGHILDVMLVCLIMVNVVAIVLESVSSIAKQYHEEFFLLEIVSITIFSIEYIIRLWTCVDRVKYAAIEGSNTKRRLHYIFSPLALIDLIAILPSLLMFFFMLDLRFLRVLRLLRVFKLTRYSRAMQLLLQAFIDEGSTLLAAFFIMAVVLILASCGIYLLEHDIQPDKFGSIPAAMWWAMATLTTVGYGDVVPITPIGKLFGGVITLVSMGMVAVPTGLLASSFSEQVRKRRQVFENAVHEQITNGTLSEEHLSHLEDLRYKLGLSKLEANKAIKVQLNERSEHMFCRNCGKRP